MPVNNNLHTCITCVSNNEQYRALLHRKLQVALHNVLCAHQFLAISNVCDTIDVCISGVTTEGCSCIQVVPLKVTLILECVTSGELSYVSAHGLTILTVLHVCPTVTAVCWSVNVWPGTILWIRTCSWLLSALIPDICQLGTCTYNCGDRPEVYLASRKLQMTQSQRRSVKVCLVKVLMTPRGESTSDCLLYVFYRRLQARRFSAGKTFASSGISLPDLAWVDIMFSS